jgi:hypothetical protein
VGKHSQNSHGRQATCVAPYSRRGFAFSAARDPRPGLEHLRHRQPERDAAVADGEEVGVGVWVEAGIGTGVGVGCCCRM